MKNLIIISSIAVQNITCWIFNIKLYCALCAIMKMCTYFWRSIYCQRFIFLFTLADWNKRSQNLRRLVKPTTLEWCELDTVLYNLKQLVQSHSNSKTHKQNVSPSPSTKIKEAFATRSTTVALCKIKMLTFLIVAIFSLNIGVIGFIKVSFCWFLFNPKSSTFIKI